MTAFYELGILAGVRSTPLARPANSTALAASDSQIIHPPGKPRVFGRFQIVRRIGRHMVRQF